MHETHWPITVAYAAPFTPISGKLSKPYIIIGSRTIFTIAPEICAMVENIERPVAWRSFSKIEKNTMPNEIIQQMFR